MQKVGKSHEKVNESDKDNGNNTNGVGVKLYELIKMQPNLTREELAIEMSKTVKTIQRALDNLKEKGLIARVGSNRNGYWKI